MKYLTLIALLSACCPYPPECDYYVGGACVVGPVEAKPGLEMALEAGIEYWRARPDLLAGWTIVLEGQFATCNGQTRYSGCKDGDCPEIRLGNKTGCYEFSLSHEIGHVVIGDNGHTTCPAWDEVPEVCYYTQAIRQRTLYCN